MLKKKKQLLNNKKIQYKHELLKNICIVHNSYLYLRLYLLTNDMIKVKYSTTRALINLKKSFLFIFS